MKTAQSTGAQKIINHGQNPGNIMSLLIRLFKGLGSSAKSMRLLLRMGISLRFLGLYPKNISKKKPLLFSCNMGS